MALSLDASKSMLPPTYESMREADVRDLIEKNARLCDSLHRLSAENYEMYGLLCHLIVGLAQSAEVREMLEKIDASGDGMTWREYLKIEYGWQEAA